MGGNTKIVVGKNQHILFAFHGVLDSAMGLPFGLSHDVLAH